MATYTWLNNALISYEDGIDVYTLCFGVTTYYGDEDGSSYIAYIKPTGGGKKALLMPVPDWLTFS